jgi:small subunit ribosomal protein S16
MLKMRFKRCGKKRQPTFRLVVMPVSGRRDGKALQELGYYNPITKELKLDIENIVNNLRIGVQPSETVKNLLIKKNILKK